MIGAGSASEGAESSLARPNVLVVMVDDLGFSDLGCYGSEIETPNLDELAEGGLRFMQFYTTAKCHSSRISVMSGRHPFQAGGRSLRHSVTTAEMLQAGGYTTMMTGKWHLQEQPTDFGFERYWGHLSGSTNYFTGDDTFRFDGQPWSIPDDGFYTTIANVDFALNFLTDARKRAAPWYLHIAFNAPHAPLQPLEEDYRKYLSRYAQGWDEIRRERVLKQQRLGLFPSDMPIPSRPDHLPAWKDLSPARRDFEQRRMAAYAGMIDRVDQELGRLFANLTNHGELENTFVLFVSDNGACPYDRFSRPVDGEPYVGSTSWSDSTGWAWARNTPFQFYKQNQHEGGITTAAIAHWPAGLKTEPGSLCHAPVHLIDVLPTLSEITGTPIPQEWPGRELKPLAGESFAPILADKTMALRAPLYFMYATDRALRTGPWKLVSFRLNPWELYNLDEDRTETRNLADQLPERRDAMVKLWHELAEQQDEAPEKLREPVNDTILPGHDVHMEWTDFSLDPSTDRLGYGKTRIEKPKNEVALVDSATAFNAVDITTLPSGTDSLDLFLLAGQSNMKGRGEIPTEQSEDERLVMLHLKNDQWYRARHPLHMVGEPDSLDGSDNAGVGPGLDFARRVARTYPKSRLGLIPAAVGGSNINLWIKGGRLYEEAMRRTKLALAQGPAGRTRLRGILWLQGESDARDTRYQVYEEKLDSMIESMRAELGQPDLPFVAATVAPVVETKLMQQRFPHRAEINEILLGLAERVTTATCVDTRDLKSHIGDNLHFDTPAQAEIGRRMALAWLALRED